MNNQEINTSIPLKDAPREIKVTLPDTKAPALIPSVKNPVYGYNSYPPTGRNVFLSAEYNLMEIGKIIDTESYVARAFDKKVALMFKEGWDFVGKNPRTIKYIKTRFEQIASASGIPTGMLFRSIGSGLIQKSNTILAKVRNIEASGGKPRQVLGTSKTLDPVAAYFVTPAEAMEYETLNNKITRWQQNMPTGAKVPYDVDNIVHFFYNRKDGFVFGTPTITPVIDDIRALRQIEENVELLVYQHLFPLFQWIIGTEDKPCGVAENGQREVDILRAEIQNMPAEGAIVTTERHKIQAIGAEGRALRAENYLAHFKKRVFGGLGVSAVDFGEGETANRATSDNMSQNLIDSVKDFQQVMEFFVNELIIKELLLESTFGDDILDDENKVSLKFKEIDIAMQIKKEAHYADQFNKYVINLSEARLGMGREPMSVPSQDDIDNGNDDLEQFPDFYMMKWMLFDRPKFIIQAVDEPYVNLAKSRTQAEAKAAEQTAMAKTDQDLKTQEIQIKKKALSIKRVKNSSESNITDSLLSESFDGAKRDIITYISGIDFKDLNKDWIGQLIRTSLSPVVDKFISEQLILFRKGYGLHNSTTSNAYIVASKKSRSKLTERAEKYINKLIEDIVKNLRKRITDSSNVSEVSENVMNVFESLFYRVNFINDFEKTKAFFLGKALSLKDKGYSELEIFDKEGSCEQCSLRNKEIVDLRHLAIENLPPFHPGCECNIRLKTETAIEKKSVHDINTTDNIVMPVQSKK